MRAASMTLRDNAEVHRRRQSIARYLPFVWARRLHTPDARTRTHEDFIMRSNFTLIALFVACGFAACDRNGNPTSQTETTSGGAGYADAGVTPMDRGTYNPGSGTTVTGGGAATPPAENMGGTTGTGTGSGTTGTTGTTGNGTGSGSTGTGAGTTGTGGSGSGAGAMGTGAGGTTGGSAAGAGTGGSSGSGSGSGDAGIGTARTGTSGTGGMRLGGDGGR